MRITKEGYIDARGNSAGYCVACDDITLDSGVEPDAEEYECPGCSKRMVMGMELANVHGCLEFVG